MEMESESCLGPDKMDAVRRTSSWSGVLRKKMERNT